MTAHEKNQLDDVNKNILRILSYLENDPTTGSKGLVERTKDLEQIVSNIQTDEKVKRGKLAGVAIVGSAVVSVLIWVIKEFII